MGIGYEEQVVQLTAGDRVYLYSDGVPEAMNPAGEPFGNDRLLAAIARGRSLTLGEAVAAVEGEVIAWCGQAAPRDDVSVLAVEAV